jgi:hypothetical protein
VRLREELKQEGVDARIKLGWPGELTVLVDGKVVWSHAQSPEFLKPGDIARLVRS